MCLPCSFLLKSTLSALPRSILFFAVLQQTRTCGRLLDFFLSSFSASLFSSLDSFFFLSAFPRVCLFFLFVFFSPVVFLLVFQSVGLYGSSSTLSSSSCGRGETRLHLWRLSIHLSAYTRHRLASCKVRGCLTDSSSLQSLSTYKSHRWSSRLTSSSYSCSSSLLSCAVLHFFCCTYTSVFLLERKMDNDCILLLFSFLRCLL